MRKIQFIVSDNTVTAYAEGKSYTIGKEHPNYDGIKQAIKDDNLSQLIALADIPKGVTSFTKGQVQVKDGVVYYGDEALHNTLTDRILALMREGFPFEPMLRFLENLMENPAMSAVNELYTFLDHQHLPITEDGCFLGYKRVRDDWTDIYSGKLDNHVGKKVTMPRNKVDDNRSVGCSKGLHVGCISYVKGYSGSGCDGGGHVVIVKVNPKDVVSVPSDSNGEKLRCCEYEVIGVYEGDLDKALYTATGQPATAITQDNPVTQNNPGNHFVEDEDEDEDDDSWDEDYDDEDEEDDDEDEDYEDEDEEDILPPPPAVTDSNSMTATDAPQPPSPPPAPEPPQV